LNELENLNPELFTLSKTNIANEITTLLMFNLYYTNIYIITKSIAIFRNDFKTIQGNLKIPTTQCLEYNVSRKKKLKTNITGKNLQFIPSNFISRGQSENSTCYIINSILRFFILT